MYSAAMRDSDTRLSQASCRFRRELRRIRRVQLIVTAVVAVAGVRRQGGAEGVTEIGNSWSFRVSLRLSTANGSASFTYSDEFGRKDCSFGIANADGALAEQTPRPVRPQFGQLAE